MNGKIDLPTVLADLQAAVAERGDGYVYKPPNDEADECVYIEEGPNGEAIPSCIVGHVLARHELLTRSYALDNVALNNEWGDADEFYDDFTPEAVAVLAEAQKVQDKGVIYTWGDALIAAKQKAEEFAVAEPVSNDEQADVVSRTSPGASERSGDHDEER